MYFPFVARPQRRRPGLVLAGAGGAALLATIAVPVAAALLPAAVLSKALGGSPLETAAAPVGAAAGRGRPSPAPGPQGGVRWPADPAASAALLTDTRVRLSPWARADLAAGTVDGRVLAVLAYLARAHTLEVSVLRTGHAEFVAGTARVSNHFYGRAADVVAVDGEAVSATSSTARLAVLELLAGPAPFRPDELGSPFAFHAPGAFSDAAHRDHLHVGFGPPPSP